MIRGEYVLDFEDVCHSPDPHAFALELARWAFGHSCAVCELDAGRAASAEGSPAPRRSPGCRRADDPGLWQAPGGNDDAADDTHPPVLKRPWPRAGSSEREALGLTRLEPVSRTFGFERGKPIDRWYIERFLAAHAADVRGRVLEVAEPTYTTWYGGGDVTSSDVLHAAPGNPEATVVGDLTTGAGLPAGAYDCFVMTQTLPFIFDLPAAVRGTRDVLGPGGVLLATVPGISQISREDRRDWGDYWRFTSDSARRLFADAYGAEHVEVTAHGNVLAAAAFLYGFAAEELTEAELAHADPDFELLMTIRATRPT